MRWSTAAAAAAAMVVVVMVVVAVVALTASESAGGRAALCHGLAGGGWGPERPPGHRRSSGDTDNTAGDVWKVPEHSLAV